MIARCWCGGCDWEAVDPSAVQLAVQAEEHRRDAHFWVTPGKCHRVELEPEEQATVDRLVDDALRARAVAAVQTREAKGRYDREGR